MSRQRSRKRRFFTQKAFQSQVAPAQASSDVATLLSELSLQSESNLFTEKILTNDLLSEIILDAASPGTILCLSRTCRNAYTIVQWYLPRAYDINRHLKRYFPDPLAFRSLQARTCALVSGSSALQFFTREAYSDSDLDIYVSMKTGEEVVQWVMQQDYIYKPGKGQDSNLERQLQKVLDEIDEYDSEYSQALPEQIMAVFTFIKRNKPDFTKQYQVQVIFTAHSPMEAVLKFHSTLVMNVISWDRAYSLYPRATLEERLTLYLVPERLPEVIDKYSGRGWCFSGGEDRETLFSTDTPRWIGDGRSWVIRLPMTGITLPPPVNVLSKALSRDPCVATAWCLKNTSPYIAFRVNTASDDGFLHDYVVYGNYIQAGIRSVRARHRQKLYDRTQPRLYLDEDLMQYCTVALEGWEKWRKWR